MVDFYIRCKLKA